MSQKSNILIVDDDEANIAVIQQHLKREKYNLNASNRGEQAWQLLEDKPDFYDVVILDQLMLDTDGIEILSRIKAHEVLNDIPVILQTAAKGHIQAGLQAGAYSCLVKPVQAGELKSLLASAIIDYQLLRKLRTRLRQNNLTIEINAGQRFKLRTIDEAYDLAVQLAKLCPSPEQAVTGLAELLFNAIEHGNLGISYDEKTELIAQERLQDEISHRLTLAKYKRKFVEVDVVRTHDKIRFTVKDQGKGFRWQEYLQIPRERAFDNHGRGITLARQTSFDQLVYHGIGNHVEAIICTRKNSGVASAPESINNLDSRGD